MHLMLMNNLEYYREQKGLTQKQLASLVNSTQPTIQRTEKGISNSLPLLQRCAKILNISMAQMFAKNPSPVLDQIITMLESVPADSHPGIFAAVKMAEALPSQEGDADTLVVEN